VIQSWSKKWDNLSVYFRYPEPIRKMIYTTNSIEAVHRQFRSISVLIDAMEVTAFADTMHTKSAFNTLNNLTK